MKALWIIGWMFTSGMAVAHGVEHKSSTKAVAATIAVATVAWPVLLGAEVYALTHK